MNLEAIKIAIHPILHSASDRWIEYCEKNHVNYKIVDCTKNDIIYQLADCDGLMWHWGQSDYKSQLFARQLTLSIEKMGKMVYPNSYSCWHFDDKLGQKYLFEALGAPLEIAYVFYTKKEALLWVEKTIFPKVFKLRGGAGSLNVELIRSKKQAIKKINIAFGKGFPAYGRIAIFKEKIWKLILKKDISSLLNFIKSTFRLIIPKKERVLLPREKGYVYFQDFVPNKKTDTRMIALGDRCFGTIRHVRKNDFRASGSGVADTLPILFDKKSIGKAFEIRDKVGAQTLAFDFLLDQDQVKVIEMSYAFPVSASDNLPGHWDRNLVWHEGLFKCQYWMVENFISEILQSKNGNK